MSRISDHFPGIELAKPIHQLGAGNGLPQHVFRQLAARAIPADVVREEEKRALHVRETVPGQKHEHQVIGGCGADLVRPDRHAAHSARNGRVAGEPPKDRLQIALRRRVDVERPSVRRSFGQQLHRHHRRKLPSGVQTLGDGVRELLRVVGGEVEIPGRTLGGTDTHPDHVGAGLLVPSCLGAR